jgi:hypothetical protein
MARPTIVLNRSDVKSEIHPNLFDSFLDELGLKAGADDVILCVSPLDDNEKVPE